MNDIAAYAGNESAYTKSGRRLAYLSEREATPSTVYART